MFNSSSNRAVGCHNYFNETYQEAFVTVVSGLIQTLFLKENFVANCERSQRKRKFCFKFETFLPVQVTFRTNNCFNTIICNNNHPTKALLSGSRENVMFSFYLILVKNASVLDVEICGRPKFFQEKANLIYFNPFLTLQMSERDTDMDTRFEVGLQRSF